MLINGTNNNDSLTGSEQADQMNGYFGDDDFLGRGGNDTIFGNEGNDELDGDSGMDSLVGGPGHDIYTLRSDDGDLVIETPSSDIDMVEAYFSYTLPENVEYLYLYGGSYTGTGNAAVNKMIGSNFGNDTLYGLDGDDVLSGGTSGAIVWPSNTPDVGAHPTVVNGNDVLYGGNGNDKLHGGAGNDILDGGTGIDSMYGGNGDDTYYIDSLSDLVDETGGNGTDTVVAGFTITTLASGIEVLQLTGASPINGTGNTGNNTITGNSAANNLNGGAGNDTLNGGTGNDTLTGGTGNDSMNGGNGDDTYYVDSASDQVNEGVGGGYDTVYTTTTYALGSEVERIIVSGNLAIALTGNSAANNLQGGSNNDTLDGGLGADSMQGNGGNDTYHVDNAGDTVTDSAGTDTVISQINFSLGANVENLVLSGAAVSGLGNGLANNIQGNTLDNSLDGGIGIDTLTGGAGNDNFYVDNAGDQVVEIAGEGVDIVYASASYSLASEVENLNLVGAAVNGTGNTLNNTLTGNELANLLKGGAGDDNIAGMLGDDKLMGEAGKDYLSGGVGKDQLNGGGGNDTLIGGEDNDILIGGGGKDTLTGDGGKDLFTFNSALASSNVDTLTDFNGIDDNIRLDDDFFLAMGFVGSASNGDFLQLGAAALDADDRIIYDISNGGLYYDADGSGASAMVQFAVLGTDSHPALTYSDFVVID
ncbi:MAG TPA: calcium-binding protein [Burkholderiales bacterium]|nr:calcium-binding protein [Burkholderiales bacterium]